MQKLAVPMLLLLAAAMAADDHDGHDHGAHGHESEECSCAQYEPDHPFTIDCDDAAPIRAATITLETTCASEVRFSSRRARRTVGLCTQTQPTKALL